ncbi:MAG TPA: hypothetical protein VNL92_00055 [Dehalococcoidia bacterium]|nr:hypothetical protein [Dehalococcoidia bacterium]
MLRVALASVVALVVLPIVAVAGSGEAPLGDRPVALVEVTPNEPWHAGLNAVVVQGPGSASDIVVTIEALSGLQVDALWALFNGAWVYLLPDVPAIEGGFAPANEARGADSLAAMAVLRQRSIGVTYHVRVYFNETVTQPDLDATAAFFRGFDPGADMLILETFPPIGGVDVTTNAPAFCESVRGVLGAKPYVRSVECGEALPPPVPLEPDMPVTSG